MVKRPEAVNWTFTVNNYTEEEYKELLEGDYNYIIIGKEVGDSGTPHLQGYLQLKKKKRLTAMKKIHQTAHWEIARGTAEENKVYCSKDNKFEERGTMVIAGKKKVDMVKAVYQIVEGTSTKDLLDEHGAGYIMHKKKIEEVDDCRIT